MTRCEHCGADLSKLSSVHSVLGSLYCSKECAISAGTIEIRENARAEAEERYHDSVEIVATTDIGLHGPGFENLIQYIELECSCDYATALEVALKVVDNLDEAIGEAMQQ
jgi:hypothetical protein